VDIIDLGKLQDLLQKKANLCVSLYMPTHPVGREQQQDPIRLKNLLSETRAELAKRGLRHPEVETLIEPAERLLSNSSFWQHQSQGLAMFIADDIFQTYRLPLRFEPFVAIAENFHIKPILPLVSGNQDFYILAISQNEIRFLHGDRFDIAEVDLESIPTSLQEALWFDDPERQLQFHTGTAASSGVGGARPSIFHGHGVTDDDAKIELLRYFQKVNQGLMNLLRDEQAPLVLAGVDYLLPIYRSANDYPYLVEDAIIGNPDELSAEELHRAAWRLVKPIVRKELHESLDRYQELMGTNSGLSSNQIEEIVPAAFHGRIDTLFVTLGAQVWGTYDGDEMAAEVNNNYQPGDQDLLDFAASNTILNGGNVYALEIERMPDELVAAIFRFSYQD
jgi:hypothetical protein